MSFSDAMDNAMGVWFGADFADQVTLNGVSVNAQIEEQAMEESGDGMADFIEIEFKASDYAALNYRTDTVTANGLEWKYPVQVRGDAYNKTVRFRRNIRPRAAR